MEETGRLAVFTGPREPFELREYPLPELEPGAMLLKVTAANICGTDLHIWRGDMGADFGPGHRPNTASAMGHEMTGRVHGLGKGLAADSLGQPLREGDRVTFAYFYPCRKCPTCASGDLYACPYTGFSTTIPLGEHPYFTGAFADYYYLRPGHVAFKLPDELSDELAAPVNCAFSEVAFGLEKAGVTFGERVVIQGAGGLGLYATAIARERGAASVIVVDGQTARLEIAWGMGASETIDLNECPTAEARVARVKELTGGRGADVVVGVVGFAAAFAEGIRMVRKGGPPPRDRLHQPRGHSLNKPVESRLRTSHRYRRAHLRPMDHPKGDGVHRSHQGPLSVPRDRLQPVPAGRDRPGVSGVGVAP